MPRLAIRGRGVWLLHHHHHVCDPVLAASWWLEWLGMHVTALALASVFSTWLVVACLVAGEWEES